MVYTRDLRENFLCRRTKAHQIGPIKLWRRTYGNRWQEVRWRPVDVCMVLLLKWSGFSSKKSKAKAADVLMRREAISCIWSWSPGRIDGCRSWIGLFRMWTSSTSGRRSRLRGPWGTWCGGAHSAAVSPALSFICVHPFRSLLDPKILFGECRQAIKQRWEGWTIGGAFRVECSVVGVEANEVLMMQARCRPDDTWCVQSARFASGSCDAMIVALKLEANWQEKENFIEVFYEGNNEKQRDKDVGGFAADHWGWQPQEFGLSQVLLISTVWRNSCAAQNSTTVDFIDAAVDQGAAELLLRVRKRRVEKTFVRTTKMDRNIWCRLLVESDWSAMCQTLFGEVGGSGGMGGESIYNFFREAANKVGIKKVGKRSSLLCKLSDTNRAGELWCQVKHTTQ